MTKVYALIDPNGNILNLVQWDGLAPFNVAPNSLVDATSQPNAQIGGTYLAGLFTAPAAPVSPPGIVFQNSPVTGATVALPQAVALGGQGYGKQYAYLQPAGALAALTLLLPASPADGDEHYIFSTKSIAAVTPQGNGNALLNFGAPFALAAGASQHITYSAQLGGWFHL